MRSFAYTTGLLLALATALPAYVSSTYLAQALGETAVGAIYALGAIFALLLLSIASWLLQQFSLESLMLGSGLLTGLLALILAATPTAPLLVIVFALFYALSIFLRLLSDFYLEETSENRQTGRIRGIFLTLINLGWLISPLLSAMLVESGSFRLLYITAGLLFMPLGLLTITYQSYSPIKKENPWQALKRLILSHSARNNNLKKILAVDLWLNIFYALMVIYMPIYLNQRIGLEWPQIGLIFTWMLLPFVLLDYPLGWLADKKWGEKEILVAGLIIAGLATIISALTLTADVVIWSVILFLTRVGAASVEVMKETYLFKKIDSDDLDLLSLSRNLIPLSYLIGPIIAFVILSVSSLNTLFILLGLSSFLLLPLVWKLVDTK